MSEPAPLIVPLSEFETGWLVAGSAVALGGAGVLMIGASGTGKSVLALELMALGATLIGDDRLVLDGEGAMSPPPTIAGQIEARGVGILRAETTSATAVLVINMDLVETDRLPPRRRAKLGLRTVPCLHKIESAHFPAMVLQYLKGTEFS